ncbi:MAG: nucleoside monophosphate kinase [Planctomycetaceae bacterium]|nr:nucleoside monophosphate kinase [Planctomycetaceae bacterium]
MTDNDRYQTVLLFGAPGAGKGTQGSILGHIPGFYHLSCGEVFRSLDIHSPEGKIVYETTSQGKFVPDDLTIKIWKKSLGGQVALSNYKPHEDILILDGLPRNIAQVELVKEHINVRRILYLVCEDEEAMIHRIRRRAIRENRVDDANETIIRQRFEIYREQTAPVLDCYPQELISQINAMGSPAEVLQSVLKELVPVQNEHYRQLGRKF